MTDFLMGKLTPKRCPNCGEGHPIPRVEGLRCRVADNCTGADILKCRSNVASNMAFWYLISRLENTIYVDMGEAVSACGCVLEAYFLYNRS